MWIRRWSIMNVFGTHMILHRYGLLKMVLGSKNERACRASFEIIVDKV